LYHHLLSSKTCHYRTVITKLSCDMFYGTEKG
jgi:hypothetical protein